MKVIFNNNIATFAQLVANEAWNEATMKWANAPTIRYRTSSDLSLPAEQWQSASVTLTVVDSDADGDGQTEIVEVAMLIEGTGVTRLFLN